MPFKPGQARPANAGRKKGTPNKITAVMKDDWLEAYHRRGGVEFLMGLGDEIFAKGLLRLIPNEVAAEIRGTMVNLVDLSDQRGDDDGLAEG